MTRQVIYIGPRGGKVVKDDGGRKEYQRPDAVRFSMAVIPRVELALARAREEAFRYTRHYAVEYGILLDERGAVIDKRHGDRTSLSYTAAEVHSWRGRKLSSVHTHPCQCAPSGDDFKTLFDGRLAVVEAVEADTGDHSVRAYRLELDESKLTDAGKAVLADPLIAVRDSKALALVLMPEWVLRARAGQLSWDDAVLSLSDHVARALASRYGVAYTVVGKPMPMVKR